MSAKRRMWLGRYGGVMLACVACVAPCAQGTDADFKALYAAAEYDEALEAAASFDSFDARLYTALCLTALGRQADAIAATEALVAAAPTFVPAPQDAPPRFVELVARVRKRVLPSVTLGIFGEGRDLYLQKRHAEALDRFAQVLALIADPDFEDLAAARDLKILALGFGDLAQAAVSPASALPPARGGGPRR